MNFRPLLLYSLLATITVLVHLGPRPASPQPAAAALRSRPAVVETQLSHLPLQFEVNRGQGAAGTHFLAHGSGYNLLLMSQEAVLALTSTPDRETTVVRLHFVGTATNPVVEGVDRLPGVVNYFLGPDPAKWRTGIPTYAAVKYRDLYPGIDLQFHGSQKQLEHDFIVAPGGDPAAIVVRVEGVETLDVDGEGNLILHTPAGPLQWRKPYAYQERGGSRRQVEVAFTLDDDQQFGYAVAAYDHALPLVIDPVLEYSTTLGGNGSDYAYAATSDAAGNLYITGATNSTDFPVMDPVSPFTGKGIDCPDDEVPYRLCYDGFITKLNPTGSTILYSTYIGSYGDDEGRAIAVDAAGNAYMAGYLSLEGAGYYIYENVFVFKLTPTGGWGWGSWWGPNDSYANAIAVDSAGYVYVGGETNNSAYWTSPTAVQPDLLAKIDGFITVLSPDGQNRVYSTYLGGSDSYCEVCYNKVNGIAVDDAAYIYVTGQASPSFPTTANAFQRTFGGYWMAFVAKIDPAQAGTAGLVYSTYLGGERNEFGEAIALDGAGKVYVTGSTNSDDFPTTAGAYDRSCGTDGICNHTNTMVCDYTVIPPVCQLNAKADVFVARLDLSKTGAASLLYATYVGGSGRESGQGLALDPAGNAYVTGYTVSPDFPLVNPVQATIGGNSDAFLFRLNNTASALGFSTFLGGSGDEYGRGVARVADEHAYVVGFTDSANFPLVNPLRPRAAQTEAFITRIDTRAAVPPPNPVAGHHVYLPVTIR